MRKPIVLLITICFCISLLSACSGEETYENTSPSADWVENTSSEEVTDADPSSGIVDESNNTDSEVTQPIENKVDIAWTNVTYVQTDSDGYKYEVTFTLSPWILLSNADAINSAWSEVGGNYELPEFDDWSLKKSGNNYCRDGVSYGGSSCYFSAAMTDMYYCIGSIQIKNITDGWGVTTDNKRSVPYDLLWVCAGNDSCYNWETCTISRTFFSNGAQDHSKSFNYSSASMSSDTWGPVPFIFMAPENFSPNFPSGEYSENMLDGYFHAYYSSESYKIHIGLIDETGTYIPPKDTD